MKIFKRYLNALLTKFLLFAPLIGMLMPIYSSANIKEATITAVLATLAAFLTADLVIYPHFGNLPGIIGDAFITMLVMTEMSKSLNANLSWIGVFLIIGIIIIGEWNYHLYLDRTLFPRRKRK
ncbi:MAG: DUF2512 family protein [Peptococcaceae bacterium]|nr:DUF2512 family protein [Peptococcaceae bacterium]